MTRMSEPQWRWLLRLGLVTAIAFISWLAFTDRPPEMTLQVSDKFNHALAFFVLAAMLDQAFLRLHAVLGLALPLLLYGTLIEVVQGSLGYREISFLDVLADAVGIATYLLVRDPMQRLAGRFFIPAS